MQLQTFKAPTMAECLTQVKTAMGNEALILHTRTYQTKQWMGLRRKEVVEITAGKGMRAGGRPRPAAGGSAAAGALPSAAKSTIGTAVPGTYARQGAKPGESAGLTGPKSLLDTPAGAGAAMLSLTSEVTTLKQMMKEVLQATKARQAPQVPEDLFDYFDQLAQSKVCETLASEILQTLQRQVRADHYKNEAYMRDRLIELIDRVIPVSGPITRKPAGGPHVVALVGPTGVGKTTTLAKLAANLKLRERHRVGLITLDTYRIAAVDQLRRYAEIIGAPLKVVSSAEDLKEAIGTMAGLDFVLIDTAGRSPKDSLKLNELKRVLESARPDEVHLVLSTTAGQESVELAISRFAEVRVDKLLFTKLDEAACLGTILNVAKRVGKPLSYLTTGQDVPDDIEVAHGKRVAGLILGDEL